MRGKRCDLRFANRALLHLASQSSPAANCRNGLTECLQIIFNVVKLYFAIDSSVIYLVWTNVSRQSVSEQGFPLYLLNGFQAR